MFLEMMAVTSVGLIKNEPQTFECNFLKYWNYVNRVGRVEKGVVMSVDVVVQWGEVHCQRPVFLERNLDVGESVLMS